MLGITQCELEKYFKKYITLLSQKENKSTKEVLTKVKFWYNGFCFDGENPSDKNRLYNPFSILLLFDDLVFRNYWFDSGTPKFLIDLIIRNQYNISNLEFLKSSLDLFDSYEPDTLKLIPLLFQTGYITLIKKLQENLFLLSYPNYEIKKSFLLHILKYINRNNGISEGSYIIDMLNHLKANNIGAFIEGLKVFFSGLPYSLHTQIHNKEQYYHSILYTILALLGIDIEAEIYTNKGRIDLVVELQRAIYIIEVKINDTIENALSQIKDMGYSEKFANKNKTIYTIAIIFSTETRNVKEFKVLKQQ